MAHTNQDDVGEDGDGRPRSIEATQATTAAVSTATSTHLYRQPRDPAARPDSGSPSSSSPPLQLPAVSDHVTTPSHPQSLVSNPSTVAAPISTIPTTTNTTTSTSVLGRRRRQSSVSMTSSARDHLPLSMAAPPPTEPPPNGDDEEEQERNRRREPAQIAPMLCCPCCPPGSRLIEPSTLRCGHTVCASHLRDRVAAISPEKPQPSTPPCPLPTCKPSSSSEDTLRPKIPANSSIRYIPAQVEHVHTAPSTLVGAMVRQDVTTAKVIDLIARAERRFAEEAAHRETGMIPRLPDVDNESTDEEDDGEEDEDDADGEEDELRPPPHTTSTVVPPTPALASGPAPSRSRARARSVTPGSPNARPRKRRRPAAAAALRGPITPMSLPPPNVPLRPWFEKELLSELTCEICYVMFYQPVTTPCQHVRISLGFCFSRWSYSCDFPRNWTDGLHVQTFCSTCLQRSLDHSSTCPLCREEMPGYAYFQDHAFNKLLYSIRECLVFFSFSFFFSSFIIMIGLGLPDRRATRQSLDHLMRRVIASSPIIPRGGHAKVAQVPPGLDPVSLTLCMLHPHLFISLTYFAPFFFFSPSALLSLVSSSWNPSSPSHHCARCPLRWSMVLR
jgi:hypothetical protein